MASRPAQYISAVCFVAAHAVSHKGLVKTHSFATEHGMEPMIFWSAICGTGRLLNCCLAAKEKCFEGLDPDG